MGKTIWTLGHSTHSTEYFLEILRSFEIELLADIRSYPGSKINPQFNKENLEKISIYNGIFYKPIPELGGRRKIDPDSKNTSLSHPAFRAYADYMETEDFKKGINILTESAIKYRAAFMCAESLWWKCHRSLISDYLKSIGWKVIHILGINKSSVHTYTSAAKITDGKLNYKSLL